MFSTCYKGNVRKLATSNGLKFVDVPECLKVLSVLEERMVAPYINFMQLRPLKAYALNSQIGMKGSVVNIPMIWCKCYHVRLIIWQQYKLN